MKIYHLTIAYNDKTEEIVYIQEEIESDGVIDDPFVFTVDMDEDYFDDEVLIRLIDEFGMGEA